MTKQKIPDVAYNRRLMGIDLHFQDGYSPKIIWSDDFVEIKTDNFSIIINFRKDDDLAAKNRSG
jgi:hypothetical protein